MQRPWLALIATLATATAACTDPAGDDTGVVASALEGGSCSSGAFAVDISTPVDVGFWDGGVVPTFHSAAAMAAGFEYARWALDMAGAAYLDGNYYDAMQYLRGAAIYLTIVDMTGALHPSWRGFNFQALMDLRVGRTASLYGQITPHLPNPYLTNVDYQHCVDEDADPDEDVEEIEIDLEDLDLDLVTGPDDDLGAIGFDDMIDFGNDGQSTIDDWGNCTSGCDAPGWDYFDIGIGDGGLGIDAGAGAFEAADGGDGGGGGRIEYDEDL